MTSIRVGLIQQHCVENTEENLENTVQYIHEAAKQGAQLVQLPELHRSLYFCQHESPEVFDLAEPINGPTIQRLLKVAKELKVVINASIFERRAEGLYHNTAVILEKDGSIAGTYRKMHIPNDPGYSEKYFFAPGDQGFKPINTSLGRLGILVCWDQWYPEAARLMALAGAQLLFYPTAIGWDPTDPEDEQQRQLEAWQIIQRSHAVANTLPVISCNRVGFEKHPIQDNGINFWGSSFMAGPQGEIICQAPTHEAGVLVSKINLARTEEIRRVWTYFRDRRIDAYEGLCKRYID